MPVRILHLIPNLRIGGAETMLAKLVGGLDRARFENRVLTMSSDNPLADAVRAADVQVDSLGLNTVAPNPLAVFRLARMLKDWRPDILQTWLYHADLLGTLAAAVSPGPALIWNIRCSDLDMGRHGWRLAAVRYANARLSRRPRLVLANSEAGRRVHEKLGFRPRAWSVVPNGFDLDAFWPDPAARARTRTALGIGEETVVIGIVARWDPQKDHETFIRAARRLSGTGRDVAFVCVGRNMLPDAPGIGSLLRSVEVTAPVHLLGPRRDLAQLYPAFDIAALTSRYGEGFPNVVGEAMACGLPCTVTDVGDCAAVVGDTGLVVPAAQPDALAQVWERLADGAAEERRRLGNAARDRIKAQYSLEAVVARYGEIYEREAAAYARP